MELRLQIFGFPVGEILKSKIRSLVTQRLDRIE